MKEQPLFRDHDVTSWAYYLKFLSAAMPLGAAALCKACWGGGQWAGRDGFECNLNGPQSWSEPAIGKEATAQKSLFCSGNFDGHFPPWLSIIGLPTIPVARRQHILGWILFMWYTCSMRLHPIFTVVQVHVIYINTNLLSTCNCE